MRVLIISNVWIEPASSAAGRRMLQLLKIFIAQGWELTYASTAKPSDYAEDLKSIGIATEMIAMNNEGFDAFAKALSPQIVLFDRFMAEEQFGWRIAQECPDALLILDTEDLHCLRKARQLAVKEERFFSENDLVSDVAKREIASIYRCDLTLMISKVEMQLLQEFFKVPEALLRYLPFLEAPLHDDFTGYAERKHFVAIGNFLHLPNWDATLQLKKEIWPLVRKELPKAQLHVYGAYPSDKVLQLHNEQAGFIVKGRAASAEKVVTNARVLLAPLRFGAGLKGKFIEAMQCGTPSVTTGLGAEGMAQELPWSGFIADENEAFAKAAIQLYTDQSVWEEAQRNGITILNTNFQQSDFQDALVADIRELKDTIQEHRAANFTGQMLHHHTLQSTKYFSKWIEAKNK